jgi:hypothetical protein
MYIPYLDYFLSLVQNVYAHNISVNVGTPLKDIKSLLFFNKIYLFKEEKKSDSSIFYQTFNFVYRCFFFTLWGKKILYFCYIMIMKSYCTVNAADQCEHTLMWWLETSLRALIHFWTFCNGEPLYKPVYKERVNICKFFPLSSYWTIFLTDTCVCLVIVSTAQSTYM